MTTNFHDLYQRYAQDVYRFAYWLCGDPAEAKDITSETFVRVWTSPEPVRTATVKCYLFTIARNLFLQGLRRKGRNVELDDDIRDPQASPQKQAEQKAELRAVLAGLQALPEADRAALLMRAFDEMPYDEIARALGLSLAAVKVKIHRARLRLGEIRNT
jgi:RNA polymerase sigma-70 factor (ECF subfamily)